MATPATLDDLVAATTPAGQVGPVDHVDSHGTPTPCGAYIDPDSFRVWPTGVTMNVRVPHWEGGLKIKMASAARAAVSAAAALVGIRASRNKFSQLGLPSCTYELEPAII